MKNQLKEAVHELNHAVDDGADYDKTVQWLSQYFGIESQELKTAYNAFVMSI